MIRMTCIDMTDEDTAIWQQIAIRRWSDNRDMHKRLVRLAIDHDSADGAYFSLWVRKLIDPRYTNFRKPEDFK